MRADIDSAESSVVDADTKKQELETVVADATAHLAAVVDEEASKEKALADMRKVADEKSPALTEARAVETEGNAALEKAKADKEVAEHTYEHSFKVLRDQELEATQAQTHLDALKQIIGAMSVDASLLTSLPAACLKPKAARGTFDAMVFDELERSFNAHFTNLSATIEGAAPAAAERAAAVEAAEQSLSAAKEAVEKAAADRDAAQVKHQEARAALVAAENELKQFLPEHQCAAGARDERAAALMQFEELNVASFTQLRDMTTKKPETAPESEEPSTDTTTLAKGLTEEVTEPAAVEVGGA
jgi:hypothetical protein